MRIGKEGYDVPTYNPDEEKQIKLQDEVQEWWDNLDDNLQFELIEDYYPDKAHLLDTIEMWNGLEWEDKYQIYNNINDGEYSLESQKNYAAEKENHRHEVED